MENNHDEKLNEGHFIMKSGKYNNVKEDFYEKSRRDALVAERGGNSQFSAMIESLHSTSLVNSPYVSSNFTGWNQVLPFYGYCALASIAPFATAGTLDEYIKKYEGKSTQLDPNDALWLSLQAARGCIKHSCL